MAMMDLVAKLSPSFRDDPIPDQAGRIDAFQRMFYSPLPEDYADFLRENGHAMFFADNRVLVPDGPKPVDVRLNSLYGVDDHRTTLVTANRMYRGRLPPGLIAIGDSGGGGDLICLDVAGLVPGTVYHWNHEREVDASGVRQSDYANMTRLAGSFTELLDRTSPVPETPAERPRIKKATLKF